MKPSVQRPIHAPAFIEILESRIAPATVHWQGGSGNWSDTKHWKEGVVPNNTSGTTYDVIIGVTGNPTITVDGSYTINSLDNSDTVTVGAGTFAIASALTDSGVFTVNNASAKVNLAGTIKVTGQISATSGQLNINNATVTATGASASLTNSGTATTLTAVNLAAMGGATIALDAVTTYTGSNLEDTTIQAGAGSKIDLSHLTNFYGGGVHSGVSFYRTHILPVSGGEIDLAGAITTNPTNPAPNNPGEANANYNDFKLDATGGVLKVAGIISLANTNFSLSGTQALNFTGLTTLTAVNLAVSGGGQMLFPVCTSYTGSNLEDTTIQAGAGSKIDLSHLNTFSGGGYHAGVSYYRTHILPVSGGEIDLAGAITTNPAPPPANSGEANAYFNDLIVDSTGGLLKVAGVTSLTNTNLTVTGSQILTFDNLATLTSAHFSVNGGQALTFPKLTTLTAVSLSAGGGSQLLFPASTTYTGSNLEDTTIQAGAGSKIDLSHLNTFSGGGYHAGVSYYRTHILPVSGGEIDLAGAITTNPAPPPANSGEANAYFNDLIVDSTGGLLKVAGVTSLTNTNLTVTGSAVFTVPAGLSLSLGSGVSFNTDATGKIVNRATLTAAGASVAIKTSMFSNQGVLNPISGGSFHFSGDLLLETGGLITGDKDGTVTVAGNVMGGSKDNGLAAGAAAVFADATVQLSGMTASTAPQKLEAMSQDVGASDLGFFSQFAYNNLEITNHSNVQLVNAMDNAPGTGAEAVYVETLTVDDGCTLDLNHLHLYAHKIVKSGSGTGTIVNGTAAQVMPLTVSKDQTTATFVEPDRDVVTVKIAGGKLDPSQTANKNITLVAADNGRGFVLQEIDLTAAQGNYNGASVTVTASGKSHAAPANAQLAGAGLSTAAVLPITAPPSADVGFLNAFGVNLSNVSIVGALHQFKGGSGDPLKPAIKLLSVDSLGDDAPNLAQPDTVVNGIVNRINVRHDVTGAEVNVSKRVGQFVVAGRITGSHFTVGGALGTLSATLGMDHTTVDAQDGLGFFNVGSTKVKGDLDGVTLDVAKTLNKFAVTGIVTGGSAVTVSKAANSIRLGGVSGATFTLHDALTALSVTGAASGLNLSVTGKLGSLVVTAPLTGSTLGVGGALGSFKATKGITATMLTAHGNLTSLAVTGTVDGLNLKVDGKLGTFSATGAIKNTLLDATGAATTIKAGAGLLSSTLTLHDALGTLAVAGTADGVHLNVSGKLGAFSATGAIKNTSLDVTGAATTIKAGAGLLGSTLTLHDALGTLAVTGDITGSTVHVGASLKTLSVALPKTPHATANVTDSVFTARGKLSPAKVSDAVAFGTVTIAGDFVSSQLLAGYDLTGSGTSAEANPDATIGVVSIKGKVQGSTIAAGVTTPNADGRLGTAADRLIANGNAIVARIASIVVGGVATGTVPTVFTGEEIGSLKVGGKVVLLTPGAVVPIGATGAVYHELGAP